MSAYTCSLSDFIRTIEKHGCQPKQVGDQWQAYCPVHEADAHGHNPSLSIRTGDKVPFVVHCHAGCDAKSIIKALGLEHPKTSSSKIVAEYDYHGADGIALFQKVRKEPKEFSIRHRPGLGSEWNWKLPKLAVYPLYHLPVIQSAIATGATICIVEGEKDVERLAAHFQVATTNFEGASKKVQKPKWRKEYTDQLTGAALVILIPDNDDPGRAHMLNIAKELQGKVGELRHLSFSYRVSKGPLDRLVEDWLRVSVRGAQTLSKHGAFVVRTTPIKNIGETYISVRHSAIV